MKKFFISFIAGILFISSCNGAVKIAGPSDDGLNYLRNEIRKLENELYTKTEKLNKCAAKNTNFQIAGTATVGLAVAGVTTNISLYSKMKDQKKMAINMGNKIKNANIQIDSFTKDLENLSENVDYDKFLHELDRTLTPTEKQRVVELYDNDFDLDKVYGRDIDDSDVLESDKVLLGKMISAVRNSQK